MPDHSVDVHERLLPTVLAVAVKYTVMVVVLVVEVVPPVTLTVCEEGGGLPVQFDALVERATPAYVTFV
jgi:low temperature requirement protein LtrA